MRRRLLALGLIVGAGCATPPPPATAPAMPAQARRTSAPDGIEERAVPVGARVPDVAVAMSDGSTERLRGTPTVLLLYRGHW